MEYVWAVVLGVVQGVTEFLPVSSSGHLAVAQEKLGMEGPRLLMTTALHAGTLGSIIALYRRDVWELVRGSAGALAPGPWGRGRGGSASEADRKGLATAFAILMATLVTAPIGLALEPHIEHLSRDLPSVGGFFLITGLLLLGTRFLAPGTRHVGYLIAIPIGIAQGLAVFPGISRSGATIVMALILGTHRDEAVRFSFLAALPVLAGAMVLEGGMEMADLAVRWPVYLIGGIAAFGAGCVSLGLLIRITHRRRLHLFAPYLVLLGLALILS
ncbi:MAG: undecaprenyl-diphosphate phosphatase [Deltaproteobacteria bacterium]|nr:undecaprenyl-diphosphate phosphatase [Deltaproteobacteria bacterium]